VWIRSRFATIAEDLVLDVSLDSTYYRAARFCVPASLPMSKKTNITLKLDTDLLRSIKVLAAQKGTSVSALLTEKLAEAVKENDHYEQSMKRSIARMKQGWDLGWKKPKSRDELHER
jgi:hypothetical protein